MEACATHHEEHHETHNMSEAIRTVLIAVISLGIGWLVHTTVENKSQISMLDYKVSQLQKSNDDIVSAVNEMQLNQREILKAVRK